VEESALQQGEEMNRNDLLEIYSKHLFIENPHVIDILAATYLTRSLDGDPVWLIPMGASGYGKTEFSRPYMDMSSKEVFFLDQVNASAFATGSGKKTSDDIGAKMVGIHSFMIIPDMANVTSMDDTGKKPLLSVLRTLFDGYIKRATGIGKPDYNNIHCNFVGMSTSIIERDFSTGSLMGTREIMYRLPTLYRKSEVLRYSPITNDGRMEISRKTRDYLNEVEKLPWMKLNEDDAYDLKAIANRMIIWRADGETDKDGYLLKAVEVESPKRIYTQISKLYLGLRKFGLGRTDAFKRIKEIEHGMGSQLREKIYRRICGDDEEDHGLPAKLSMLMDDLNVSEIEVRKNLMVLRSLGRIRKSEHSTGYGLESIWCKPDDELYH
jgi:hypothetical protein